MLFSERKRIADVEAREAAGENLWIDEIPDQARRQIAWAWQAVLNDAHFGYEENFDRYLEMIFRSQGVVGYVLSSTYMDALASTEAVLNQIEAVHRALTLARIKPDFFAEVVNNALNSHRVAYTLVDGQIVPKESDELHVEVVEPTLRLLVDARFGAAHASYLKALKEITQDDPGDAITDAAAALQQVLEALGAKGNALGSLMKDAKNRGLLGTHDQPLIDGISKVIDWVNADRTAMGDAHQHSTAHRADAWLTVHIVGALIVRLADPAKRGAID